MYRDINFSYWTASYFTYIAYISVWHIWQAVEYAYMEQL